MTDRVELGEEAEAYVHSLVSSGRYATTDEVLREGVRLVREREAKLAALDASIERGLADAAAGRTIPAEEVFAELKAKYRAMK